jgi:3-oxoacyl-[acyl-carrier protein] reductase
MDLGIRGRRAAVAAGSAGLGLGVARWLAAEGCAVAICGRSPHRFEAALPSLGDGAVAIEADLSDPEEAERFAAEAATQLGGPLDIVVANAGGPPPGSASATKLDGYREALELNCLSTIALANATVGPMRQAGWGRIIAITSIGARQPIPYLAASTTARAAVTAYIKTLSLEVAGDGVTANTVQPGSHDTERIRSLGGGAVEGVRAEIPVGHLGDPDDFGAVVAFICSKQASFITGASIIVDGGASRGLQ